MLVRNFVILGALAPPRIFLATHCDDFRPELTPYLFEGSSAEGGEDKRARVSRSVLGRYTPSASSAPVATRTCK